MALRWWPLLVVALVIVGPSAWAQTSGPADPAQLVRQLDAARPADRQAAEDRLRALGAAAIPALQEARSSDSFELAQRADRLLAELQQQMLLGARARLTADRQELRWDEPLSLRLSLHNPNHWPVRTPLLAEPDQPMSRLARESGRLLDVIDFLQVIGPDGEPLDVHVDYTLDEAELREAIARRVEEQPMVAIPPGETLEVALPAVNRGYTRVRLLDKGVYQMRFVFAPARTDTAPAHALAGLVVSNTVSVKVTEAAPVSVRRSGGPATIQLRLEDPDLVLRLQNRYDVPFHVNTNYGSDTRFAAAITLQIEQDEQQVRLSVGPMLTGRQRLQPDRVLEVAPGEELELFRLSWAELRARRELAALRDEEPCRVRATYRNLCSRGLLEHRLSGKDFGRLRDDERALIEALPQRMYTSIITSETLEAPAPSP